MSKEPFDKQKDTPLFSKKNMAKLRRCSDEATELVHSVAEEMGLIAEGINFKVFDTKKAKEVIKISKASEVAEILSEQEDLVIVIIYEEAFDRADEKTRYMWVRTALEPISFDSEKDKLNISAPTITVPMSLAANDKYKTVAIDCAIAGQLVIQRIEDEEKDRKAKEKEAKNASKRIK